MEIDKLTEAYIENIAERAATKAVEKAKEAWQKDIYLHVAQCAAAKYAGLKQLASAVGGGVIVAIFNWIIRK